MSHVPWLATGSTFMFTLISYLWILFILTILIAPIVVGLMNRPKKAKLATTEPTVEGMDAAPVEEPAPDFTDEFAEMKPS